MLDEPTMVLFPNISSTYQGRIMSFGGTFGDGLNPFDVITNKTFFIDTKGIAGWQMGPLMNHARKYANAVNLPEASVLIIGGSQTNCHGADCYVNGVNTEIAVMNPEVLRNGGFFDGPPQASPRTYHSWAVLLPNGKVFSGGSDNMTIAYQVFRPHYFDGNPSQPGIVTAPTQIHYGTTFQLNAALPFGQSIAKIVLISPGSVTHGHDPNQRYVQLKFDESSGPTVYAPTSKSLAPLGWYMLFLVSSAGVPSVAAWVQLLP